MQNAMVGESLQLDNRINRLAEVSWDFEGERSRSPLSSAHFHPGRFISQLPSVLISQLTKPGENVLDPYCGSGTTLVEAQRLSRRSVGVDINPVSVLISQAKTLALTSTEVRSILTEFCLSVSYPLPSSWRNYIPSEVQSEKWYSSRVVADLVKLFLNIKSTENDAAAILKKLCFSSILLSVCRETRHWGYVCDNTQPLGNPVRDVAGEVLKSAERIGQGYAERDAYLKSTDVFLPTLFNRSSEHLSTFMPENSVDLIVTSPPYFGVVDYVKSQRLTFEWFSYDLEKHRLSETGARSKRHRKQSEANFARELKSTLAGMYNVLKPGKHSVVVFGSSEKRPFDSNSLIELAIDVGFEQVKNLERQISLQRNMTPSLTSENIIIFKKL